MLLKGAMIIVLLVQQIVKGNISIHITWDITLVGARMIYEKCCARVILVYTSHGIVSAKGNISIQLYTSYHTCSCKNDL